MTAGPHSLEQRSPLHIVEKVRREQQNREGPSRKIVLLDLENVLFGKHAEFVSNGAANNPLSLELLRLAQAQRPEDMVVVGCNPRLAFAARSLFPSAQLVTGRGRDGADQALLQTVDISHAARRFTELCIVSGDHAFAAVAQDARRAGLFVRVVGPRFGLSTELRVSADRAVLLAENQDNEGQVAA